MVSTESLVDKHVLGLLYSSPQDILHSAPPTFHILVTHYKTPQFLERCLDSLFSQECSVPFHVHLVDDASDMIEVTELLNTWEKKEPKRLTAHRNTKRQNKGQNLFMCLEKGTFHPEDVIGIVDGDDWLAHTTVLERIVEEYRQKACWLTYGTYACSDGKTGACTHPLSNLHLDSEKKGRGFREAPWVFSHFFTAKAFLWKRLERNILHFDGKIEDGGAPDQIFNIPIAEMASSKHISHITDILYIYNNQSTLNEFIVRPQEQFDYDQRNRKRAAMKAIERPSIDFSIIMPCRGRFPLLNATLQRLKEEKTTQYTTEIILVEHSESPMYKDYALQKGITWIYVPLVGPATSPQGQFNRGLCFDIGFLYGPRAKYYICHDNDLLVPTDFWSKLQENLVRTQTKVLQTYSDRFVWQTSQEISQQLIENPSWFHEKFHLETHCTRNAPGAKGGSLTISHDAYLKVGGHDPHLFFGYAAEDSFFWSKLEQKYTIGFGEQPRIPLIHLWHPNAAVLNPYKEMMDILFHVFHSLSKEQKDIYIEHKSNHFQNKYQELKNYSYRTCSTS
jgi:hypothetical protein